MKVVLLQDIPTLGLSGEIKNVADGYGRNFLIPQRFAALATASVIRQTEIKRQEATVRRQKIEEDQKQLSQRIENVTIEMKVKAGPEGHLYGSVTSTDIARELSKIVGVDIDRRKILIKPVRQVGSYDVNVRFSATVGSKIKLIVHSDGEVETEAITAAVATKQPSVEENKGKEVKDVSGETTAS